MTATNPSVPELDMICRCSDTGRLAADQLRADFAELMKLEPSHDFATNVIMALWHDFSYEIAMLACDMWFLIEISGPDSSRVRIACDAVEDGLAALYLHLHSQDPVRA